MIIEGNKTNPCRKCGTSKDLAAHLEKRDTNEKVTVKEIRGFVSDNLRGAFQELNAIGAGTRAQKAAYHAKIALPEGERLTDEQREKAVDKLEKSLGFEGQPRAVVEHEKHGRQHFHVVWSRIDLEQMKAIDTPENYRKHEEVARELEKEFSLSKVRGAFSGRGQNEARPERNAPKWEYQQADRLNTNKPREMKAEVAAIYNASKNGQALQEGLTAAGYTLAKGEKKGVFLVVNQRGGFCSLSRQVDDKAAAIRLKLSDIDLEKVPTLESARSRANLLKEVTKAAKEETKNKDGAVSPQIKETRHIARQRSGAGMVAEFEARGYVVARAMRDDLTENKGTKAGEYVLVNGFGNVTKLNEFTTGRADIQKDFKGVEAPDIATAKEAAKAESLDRWKVEKADERAAYLGFREKTEAEKINEKTSRALERDCKDVAFVASKELHKIKREIDKLEYSGITVIGGMTNKAGKVLDKVADVAEAVIDMFDPPTPRKITPQELFASKQAQQERKAQLTAEQERGAALDRMAESVRKSKTVTVSDIRAMNRNDLEAIRDKGGDQIMLLIRQREKEQQQERERRRER